MGAASLVCRPLRKGIHSLFLCLTLCVLSLCTQKIPIHSAQDDSYIVYSHRASEQLQIAPALTLAKGHTLSLTLSPTVNGLRLLHADGIIAEYQWLAPPTQLPITRTIPFSESHTLHHIVALPKTTASPPILRAEILTESPLRYSNDGRQIVIPGSWNILNEGNQQPPRLHFIIGESSAEIQQVLVQLQQEYSGPMQLELQSARETHRYTLRLSRGDTEFTLHKIPKRIDTAVFSPHLSLEGNDASMRSTSFDEHPFRVSLFELHTTDTPRFPEPIAANISYMLYNDPQQWRSEPVELYRWSDFSNILVFASKTRAIQRRYFARLAFFAEKRGFRGRIISDAELSGRHGWNAHNYHSKDLAAFFSKVDEALLTKEEQNLRSILVHNKIISPSSDGFRAATDRAGILGFAWDVGERLRALLLGHEALHGLYYEKAEFRSYVDQVWMALSPAVQEFFQFMFSAYSYDGDHIPLVKNEMQAYLLQQPLDDLPAALLRIKSNLLRYRPQSADYIEAFFAEYTLALQEIAKELDAFINTHYGLSAGSLARVEYLQ